MDLSWIWVVFIVVGFLLNIYKRVQASMAQERPLPKPAQEPLPFDLYEEEAEYAPAPRMSSGARGPAAPPVPAKQTRAAQGGTGGRKSPLVSKQNLKNAIILREVLGEPRSKQPWRPGRK